MPSSLPPETPADTFFCGHTEWAGRSACERLPFFKEHEGEVYCVLHYPGEDKVAAFKEALERKLEVKDFNFRGVWFPDNADFRSRTFDAPADFDHAKFNSFADFNHATFNATADFYAAEFNHSASFRSATFGAAATFDFAKFRRGADFTSAEFDAAASFDSAAFGAEAIFDSATFGAPASFHSTTFDKSARFVAATFKDYVRFAEEEGRGRVFDSRTNLYLRFAKIEKPDRLSFHSVMLRPRWFVNVDARRFELINVKWHWGHINVKQQIGNFQREYPQTETISSAHRLMVIACRNLAVNAEENHRYDEASRFRYMAMEARRLESRQSWRDFASWLLGWLYWLASGYGERAWRASLVLIGIWLTAAALYTQVGFVRWEPRVSSEREAAEARRDEVGEPLRWRRALTYSLGVMTLQKPEPRPATNTAQALVMLETILGPVQAALLALAIRRKFMR
jgi:hypothetical protein